MSTPATGPTRPGAGLWHPRFCVCWAASVVTTAGTWGWTTYTGALGYGGLLGALGAGALVATLALGPIRMRVPPDPLVTTAALLYAALVAAACATRSYGLLALILLVSGALWAVLLSTSQTRVRLPVPAPVRGHAMAVYLAVFFGGQALGAVIWGVVAEHAGVQRTLWLTAVGLVAGLGLTRCYSLGSRTEEDTDEPRLPMPMMSGRMDGAHPVMMGIH